LEGSAVQENINLMSSIATHSFKQGILLFAHGSRDPSWALPLKQLLDHARKHYVDFKIELAFLEHIQPDFMSAASWLIDDQQCNQIVIRPLFLARGGHLKKDLEQLCQHAKDRWPNVIWKHSACLGESSFMQEAMLNWIGESDLCA
jgi:sirohydrochlorin cobaltochelatase